MVGVPSLTHIPIDNKLCPYIYSPGNIWAQGSTFSLSRVPCVCQYNRETFVRRKIYSLALVWFEYGQLFFIIFYNFLNTN